MSTVIWILFLIAVFAVLIVTSQGYLSGLPGISDLGVTLSKNGASVPAEEISSYSDYANMVIGIPIALAGTFYAIFIAKVAYDISRRSESREVMQLLREDAKLVIRMFTKIADSIDYAYAYAYMFAEESEKLSVLYRYSDSYVLKYEVDDYDGRRPVYNDEYYEERNKIISRQKDLSAKITECVIELGNQISQNRADSTFTNVVHEVKKKKDKDYSGDVAGVIGGLSRLFTNVVHNILSKVKKKKDKDYSGDAAAVIDGLYLSLRKVAMRPDYVEPADIGSYLSDNISSMNLLKKGEISAHDTIPYDLESTAIVILCHHFYITEYSVIIQEKDLDKVLSKDELKKEFGVYGPIKDKDVKVNYKHLEGFKDLDLLLAILPSEKDIKDALVHSHTTDVKDRSERSAIQCAFERMSISTSPKRLVSSELLSRSEKLMKWNKKKHDIVASINYIQP